jgi:RNA polymerase sigma factor (sigma-70 family)
MRRSDSDLQKVPESGFHSLSQDELLRLVVNCRESTDRSQRKRARKAWEMLVATDFDRVRGLVATFRFPKKPSVVIARDSIDDVVQLAFERLAKMFGTFRGTELRSYRAAMRTCVTYACMDYSRKEMEHEKGIGGSLDEEITDGEGGTRGRFDPEIAKQERERIVLQEQMERAEEQNAHIWSRLEELDGDRRVVLEMTRDGCSTEDIMARTGKSRDNVYKLRERGLKDLRDLLDGDGQP